MKTTFKQYLLEGDNLPRATSVEDLFASIEKGHFTKDGSDLKIEVDFRCNHKGLISLIGCPQKVGWVFDCSGNELESLEGCPQIVQSFDCDNNDLGSLKGCPQKVTGDFWCSANHLTSLESIHMHIHEIGGEANFTKNPIKSHVLGLLKIKGLQKVLLDNKEVQDIINKYLVATTWKDPSIRDIVDCQEELMDNDLEDYALL